MSNPLSTLKKTKRPPLLLPGMSSPFDSSAPSMSTSNDTNSDFSLEATAAAASARNAFFNSGYNKNNNANANKTLSSRSPLLISSDESLLPFSRVPFKTSIDDSDLLDEVTSQMALSNLKRNNLHFHHHQQRLATLNHSSSPSASASNNKNNNNNNNNRQVPNDMELMQIMMSKIKSIEAKCASVEKESREKEKRIKELESQLSQLRKEKSAARSFSSDKFVRLQRKNFKLQQKVYEMEDFLADYGLYWRGGTIEDDDDDESIDDEDDGHDDEKTMSNSENLENAAAEFSKKQDIIESTTTATISQKQQTPASFTCDYDLIVKNVNELNQLTDYNEPKIVEFSNKNGAKFETNNAINFTLYANGIALYNGPFRSFKDALTRKFCIDLMDGFYPSELQARYPDGVPFNLIDKRDVTFSDAKNSVFKSKGYRLGDDFSEQPPAINRPESAASTAAAAVKSENRKRIESQLLESPLTVEQFLNKLPASVVKNGKLINVRDDLNDLLNGNNKIQKPQVSLIETPSISTKKDNDDDDEGEKSSLITLRVKSLDGEQVYLIRMNYRRETIEDLKNYIKTHHRKRDNNNNNNKNDDEKDDEEEDEDDEFDLASVYPRKVFDNVKSTLEECDLVKNANIILIGRNRRRRDRNKMK